MTMTALTPAALAAQARELAEKWTYPDEARDAIADAIAAALGNVRDAVRAEREEEVQQLREAIEFAWGILANASDGDWLREPAKWQKAAADWRDQYLLLVTTAEPSHG